LDIDELQNFIQERQITIVDTVPALLKELLAPEDKFECLRTVISGGEKLPDNIKDMILAKGYRLYNHYGPTETTVEVLSSQCTRERVTLGHPISNLRCYILDKHRKLLPVGTPGELYISGVGVTRGYLNNPRLTSEKFIPNPFAEKQATSKAQAAAPSLHAILYRSGDLARWL
ncbi:MAG: amino acid adenylation domain-containing protein, partial [bacterium]|nr:amino acid adenylation domain-containing protein [bacterium]